MNRRRFLQTGASLSTAALLTQPATALPDSGDQDRVYWTSLASRIALPVLEALCARKLRATMPVEVPTGNLEDRRRYAHLEAFGRLMTGIAPWLEHCASDSQLTPACARIPSLAREALDAATDPGSPDAMNFSSGAQPLVDAAFLALAIVRAPDQLWKPLEARVQQNIIRALRSTRVILPYQNNWLLFSAMIETTLCQMGESWDSMRVDYALRAHNNWYKGDGVYGDGPELHVDYYNSYVIHPMLMSVLDGAGDTQHDWQQMRGRVRARAIRYAALQERAIAPDGSFAPVGRSLCYRFGAFHLLADIALRQLLPSAIAPGQVRSALTLVMRRMAEAPGTFDEHGWLRIGFCGHQPHLAEGYISTGSSYLCSAAWLPLGLPPSAPFWNQPAQLWTSKKAWEGRDLPADHALSADL